jgi:hypothetical protein
VKAVRATHHLGREDGAAGLEGFVTVDAVQSVAHEIVDELGGLLVAAKGGGGQTEQIVAIETVTPHR